MRHVRGAKVWTIVVAAGSGARFGAAKQFLDLGGLRVIDRSIAGAAAHSDGVVVVLPAAHVPGRAGLAPEVDDTPVRVTAGGSSRAESVRNGLAAVPDEASIVLVHDGARPLAGSAVYNRVIDAVAGGAAAVVPAVPVTDSIRHREDGAVDRAPLVAVQTPQGFRADVLRTAHDGGAEATDDATLVELIGGTVVVVDGDPRNAKITTPFDLDVARLMLAEETP